MLDTHQTLETPESIELTLNLAGPVVRILAFGVDFGIRIIVQIIVVIILSVFDQMGTAILLIFMFALEWFYPVLFEVFNQGKTPGKHFMGISVIHDDGTPIGWSSSIIRNLLRFVDFLPVGYMFGLITMCCNNHFKRLGDFTAGTIVVYSNHKEAIRPIPKGSPLQPSASLTLDDQRSILNYAERLHSLSPERQIELANHLSPITGKKDSDNVTWVIRIANWLRGER